VTAADDDHVRLFTTTARGIPGDGVALVEQARAGDQRAFEMLVDRGTPRALRLAMSILGSEADARDVVQDAFIRAWRELPRLRDLDRFDAWLARIVINGCRDRWRSHRRVALREIRAGELDPDREPSATVPIGDHVASADMIRRAFARLDVDQRTLLVLHYVEELPVTDIAASLGVPVGTAKWRLHRARGALGRALELERQ
jgi:RNA polymerase sigma-70 factor (ECF subfamily)